jgi:hypothetical protein
MISKKALVRSGIAAVTLAAGLVSLSANGSIANGYERDYYSDASMTQVVGTFTFECGNRRMMDGVTSPYSRIVLTWRC